MTKIFGCFSDSGIPDVARLESYLRRTGDFFKEIRVDKGVVLISWKSNDFFRIIEQDDLVLVFDGFDCFIYSFQNIAESYQKEGDRFFSRFNGQAKAIVLDIGKSSIKLVSDPFGLNFFFYMRSDDGFAFASEMKFLLSYDPSLRERLNRYALVEYALLHHVLGDKTFFEDVRLLDPASVLELDLKSFGYEIDRYLFFPSKYSVITHYSEALQKAKKLLVKSVDKRTLKDTKLLLSGGLDSRIILASIKPSKRKSLSCINFGNLKCDDVRFAKLVAKKFHIDYNFHHISPRMITENMERHIWITEAGSSHLVSYLHPILEKERPKTVLVGYFGGEIFGGHLLHRIGSENFSLQDAFRKLAMPENIQKLVFTKEFYSEIRECFDKSLEMEADCYPNVRDDVLKIEYAMMNSRGRRYINYGLIAAKEYCQDLKPFFDRDFFTFYIRIPYYHKLKHKFYFDMIRQEYPELLSIPSTTTHGKGINQSLWERMALKLEKMLVYAKRIVEKILPVSLYERNTYVSVDFWLREDREYRARIMGLLLSPRTIKRGFFDKEGIMKLLSEHDSRKHNYGWYFVMLADFELFHRLFVDGEGLKKFLS